MTAPLIFLRALIVCLATSLLIACDSSSSNNAVIPEINSFNIYTSEQTIYSFNEDTRQSTKRGEFDAGEHQFIELNTDESKQGNEFAVYAFENGIYLLDYDKANNGKVTKLTQFSSDSVICSLIPTKTASRAGFTDSRSSNRSTLDLPILIVELEAEGRDCDPLFNFRDSLNFSALIDDNTATNEIVRTAASSESVLGGLVIDYSSGGSAIINTDQDLTIKGDIGFLGHDVSHDSNGNLLNNRLVFDFSRDDEKDTWSTDIIPVPMTIPYSKQVSNQHVIVQIDRSLFVLDTQSLFSINTEESDISVQSRIDALFEIANKDDLFDTTTIETNRSQNANSFLIKQINNLFYFEGENFTAIPENQSQSETIIDFDLTRNNNALVIQENPDNSQTLLFISTESGQATTLLTAQRIELQVIGNEFFINTLELETGAGWQAHWFKTVNTSSTYDNSRFIFAHDMRETDNTLLLLSSDDPLSEEQMIQPALYIFDKSQANGRKKGVDKNNNQLDFSFGRLNTDVSSIELSAIINDKYGKLVLTGVNNDTGVGRAVKEYYYFDPTQAVSSQDINDQSLRLMLRQTL